MEISPTAVAFWNHWRDEHRFWSISEVEQGVYIATDRKRFLAGDEEFNDILSVTYTAEVCASRVEAHTFIALHCTQYALTKLGVA